MKKITKEKLESLKKLEKFKNKELYINSKGLLGIKLICPEETKAQQQYLEESKIKNMFKKYGMTGMMSLNKIDPMFDDVSEISSYQEAQIKIAKANSQFEMLPAKIRAEFNNDPAQMLDFLQKSENKEKAIELGLISKPKEIVESDELKTLKAISEKLSKNDDLNDEKK